MDRLVILRIQFVLLSSLGWFPTALVAAVYSVGPEQALLSPSDVPWESLQAGDEVRIHWRAEPYRDKWVVSTQGTPSAPLEIKGIPGPNGALPVISGRDAKTRAGLDYWNEDRGVIKIGGASHAPNQLPAYVQIRGLEVRSARPPYQYAGNEGVEKYRIDAAAIYVEAGHAITISHCRLHDSGNGLFANGDAIVVEHCHIFDNGMEGSEGQHNVYTAVDGLTLQFNHLAPLRAGSLGNNLKDRSAGLVVRYNWIEGGARQLDLVDAEDHEGRLARRPDYGATHVYGNHLIEGSDAFGSEMVHFGGDSGNREWYRPGPLYFYHNTVVSHRRDITTLFRLDSNAQSADVRNNLFRRADWRGRLALSHGWGRFHLQGNAISRGWVLTSRWLFLGHVVERENVATAEGRDLPFGSPLAEGVPPVLYRAVQPGQLAKVKRDGERRFGAF